LRVKLRFFLLSRRLNASAAKSTDNKSLVQILYLNWHLPAQKFQGAFCTPSFVLCGFVGFHCKAGFDEMVGLHSASEQHAPAYASDAAALEAAGKKEVLKVWYL
jgi:hypothetical protein